MPRQARLDSPGTLHDVILRGIEKRRIVDNVKDQEDFVSRLGGIVKETKTAIYAWALMTNHAHILLRSGTDGISKFMRRFLTGYAITYNLRHNRHGHLFQNRYKSIICDEDTYFAELVRYIHLNPLRSGMVALLSLDPVLSAQRLTPGVSAGTRKRRRGKEGRHQVSKRYTVFKVKMES